MKKLIQIGSLLSLVVFFTVASASAQSSYGTEVNIPFAFTVGDQTYEPGAFIVRVEKLATGSAALSIEDTRTEETSRVLMNSNGDASSREIKLVFDTINGERYLTKVSTPDRSYAIFRSKSEKGAGEKARMKEKGAVEVGGGANFF